MGRGRRATGTLPAGVRRPEDMPEVEVHEVYELEQDGRSLYCNSPVCVSALLTMGWRLSDPARRAALARHLAADPPPSTHSPWDHFR